MGCYSRSVFVIAMVLIAHVAFTQTKIGIRASEKKVSGELLFPRYGLTAVSDDQWVYVYGGAPHGGRNGEDFMLEGLHASIERVHPITLKSEYFGSGLHRRANHASVLLNNLIVSCGGRTQVGLDRPKLTSCEFLDLDSGKYRELPPLPESQRTFGMAEVDGYLYVIGGVLDGPQYSNSTFRLDLQQQQWEQLADISYGFSGQIVRFGQQIYLIGGYNGVALNSVLVFDTNSGEWSKKKDLPYPLSAFSATADNDFIFIFGDYERMEAIHRYDPTTGDLYLLDTKMTPRRHTAAVIVHDRAIVLGGNQNSTGKAITRIEAFELTDLRSGGVKVSGP